MSRPPGRDRNAAARSASMAGRGVFVAVLAVGIGLLVLKNGFADTGDASSNTGVTTTTEASATTTAPDTTTTAAPATPPKVIVANGAGIAGVAAKVTTFLQGKGISTLDPANATKQDYTDSAVYFVEGYQAQADQVAQQLGGVPVAAMPNPLPVASLADANVVVVVGQKPIPGVTA